MEEWEKVSDDAKKSGEKGSELPNNDPLRKYKGRTAFQGNKVKDESDMVALFSELGSAPANVEAFVQPRVLPVGSPNGPKSVTSLNDRCRPIRFHR